MRKFLGWSLLFILVAVGFNRYSQITQEVAREDQNKPAAVAAVPAKPAPPSKLSQVTIEKWSWQKGGFGAVMIATFVLKNVNEVAVKDIEVTCEHSGNSGTMIDTNKRTIYEILKAKSSKTVTNFSMGFVHSQATKSSCSITGYEYINNFSDTFSKMRQ